MTAAVVDEASAAIHVAFDKNVLAFSLVDGSALWISPQQADWIYDTARSRDGLWTATAGGDGRALLWFTGGSSPRPVRPTYELLAGEGGVSRVAFLRGGPLVSLAVNGTLRQWAVPLPPRFAGHSNWVLDIDLSGDGRWLATAGSDGYGYVLDTSDVTRNAAFLGGGSALVGIRIDPRDPHRVFGLERYGAVPRSWRWDESALTEEPFRFDKPPLRDYNYLVGIDVSPDGATVAATDTEGSVHMWDSRTGRLLPDRELPATGYPATVAFDPSGRSMLATTVRQGVRLVGADGRTERVLDHPNADFVAFDPAGERIASVADGGTVRIWSRDGTRIQDLVAHGSRLGRLSFSSDGSLLAVGSAEGLVEVWDVTSGMTLTLSRQHGDSVNDVLFARGDNGSLITASDDTTVAAWPCRACVDPEGVIREAQAGVAPR